MTQVSLKFMLTESHNRLLTEWLNHKSLLWVSNVGSNPSYSFVTTPSPMYTKNSLLKEESVPNVKTNLTLLCNTKINPSDWLVQIMWLFLTNKSVLFRGNAVTLR